MSIFDGLPIPKDKSFLKEELSRIDESWAAARFDSLPHVVHILTSKDGEGEVKVLKEQSDIIEEVVDEVVHAYHGGFNKAIQNYSQILRLFSESAQSLGELKVDLAQAKKLLGAHNKQLHQLWYRSVTLRHIISLLDQVEGIAKVPGRVEKLIAEKQFYAAVQLHVQSSLMLEREGLQAVGALQDVRSELTKLRGAFFYKVLEDLHSHLYNKGEYSSDVSSMLESDDAIPTATAVTSSMNYSHSLSRRTRKGDGDGVYRPSSVDGGSSFDGHNEDGTLDMHDDAAPNGYTPTMKANGGDARMFSRQIPVWLSDSTPDEFVEAMRKSDAPEHVKYLQTLVECLSMLGKVSAAGAIIWYAIKFGSHRIGYTLVLIDLKLQRLQHSSGCFSGTLCQLYLFSALFSCLHDHSQRLRSTIHDIITAKIKAQAGRASESRPGLGHTALPTVAGLHYLKDQLEHHLAKHKRQNGVSPTGTLAVSPVSHVMSPSGTAQISARDLLDSVLDTVVRIFENHVIVGELLESKSSQQLNMNTPKTMTADVSWSNDSDASNDTGGFSIGFSLNVLQSECQQLICEILRATPEATSADAAVQTARLASKNPSKDKRQGHAMFLHFCASYILLMCLVSFFLSLYFWFLVNDILYVIYADALVLSSLFPQCAHFHLPIMCIYFASDAVTDLDGDVGILLLPYIFPAAGTKSLVSDGSEDGLTFAFRFTDASTSAPNQGSDLTRQGWRRPNVVQEGYGTGAVLPEQGIYLAASVYRPVVQFTDKVTSMLPQKFSQLG
ncbi:hypothetical protein SASPL_125402 [Salvia splendens]|uniref:Exocyst complex component Sec8 n=1 Tax=Salvia splendens TaxID=180675 RepID=A0A8X8XH27_SALSN|nr:hypothetical protein SASPL_125402 [Salvia splendens]